MWPCGQQAAGEKQGAFSKIAGSASLRRSGNVAEPSQPEMEETKMSGEQKSEAQQVKAERLPHSHRRLIRVVPMFPWQGSATPEDKLKAPIDLDTQQGELCA